PLTNHGSLTPNAASNSLLCMTCLRLDYAETGTIPPTGNSTEADMFYNRQSSSFMAWLSPTQFMQDWPARLMD
ncbi:hypothetical protein, partial [Paraburkholderia atlantica]|uniref:hypothetical protein n=1 Tax=Paraburkholderia atlantica TaxID=2654982 RepID=UPI001C378FA2